MWSYHVSLGGCLWWVLHWLPLTTNIQKILVDLVLSSVSEKLSPCLILPYHMVVSSLVSPVHDDAIYSCVLLYMIVLQIESLLKYVLQLLLYTNVLQIESLLEYVLQHEYPIHRLPELEGRGRRTNLPTIRWRSSFLIIWRLNWFFELKR